MSEWKKARKKPVIIEFREVEPLFDIFDTHHNFSIGGWVKGEIIRTREGNLIAVAGRDYIVRGVDGEIYPVKKEIFHKTHEVIERLK